MPQYPPYSEGTKETMSDIPWDLDRLQQQTANLDSIESDLLLGLLKTDLMKAYEHLKVLDELGDELDEDNKLWLRKHEEDLDERFVYCSPRFRVIIEGECPSLPAKQRVNALHHSVRGEVNLISRPSLGSISIINLPNEVLRRISNFLLDDPSLVRAHSPEKYIKDIKSLRLTCWDLHNACSGLLVDTLIVDMTPHSLAKLECFSRHPTISKGIRTIRVILDFYDSVLATDLQTFARFHAAQFDILVCEFDHTSFYQEPQGDREFHEYRVAAVKKGHKYAMAWSEFGSGNIVDEIQYISPLRSAQELYRSRFATQQQLQDGTFLNAVAAAFARISTVETLEVRDFRVSEFRKDRQMCQRKGQPPFQELVDDEDYLVASLVYPIMWENMREYGIGHPCIDQLVNLPAAIHKAGGRLLHLDINVSGPKDLSFFATDTKNLGDLTKATQNLKTFTFVLRDEASEQIGDWPPRRDEEIMQMGRFLNHLLDTSSIQDLNMEFYFLWNTRELNLSHTFSSLIETRILQKWENLISLDLGFVPIHLSDIEALTKHVIRPRVDLDLHAMLLMSGDWASVLDILRKQTGPETLFSDMRDIDGGFVEDGRYIPEKETDEDDHQMEMWHNGICSKAEAYLRGLIDYNPFREELSPADETDPAGSDGEHFWANEDE